MDLESINFSELRDVEIAARMRKHNYEKFKALVRMHLSFELDLNTDEFDLPCHEIVYEDKGKLRKWNRWSKKHKYGTAGAGGSTTGCAASSKSGSTSADNSPTENLYQQIDAGFLFHLQELKEFLLLEKNLCQEGIFRKTGSASRQNELRVQIQNDKPLELEARGYSAHDCATIFKGYLAELPEPLLTDAHYPAHLQIAPLCLGAGCSLESKSSTKPHNPDRVKREQHVLHSVQLLLLLLPDENRQLLQHIIEMLHAVAAKQEFNKMSPENLATLFAPHLICPRNLPPEALHYVARKMSSIIAYMIVRGQDIFAVPPKLATDIRAYFVERKRRKTMSPEQTLDDSISDISTVNTVYTFVDREKTAAAHNTNTTDTELAQLYAHIQSLPESSKKRRLIKQFNKQNGQGTPLQLQAMNRLRNSESTRNTKSLSDSIKKHIFHKGIMSRTPKRQPLPLAIHATPNTINTKQHKQRVLFQSPITTTTTTTTTMPSSTTTSLTLQKSISSSSASSSQSSCQQSSQSHCYDQASSNSSSSANSDCGCAVKASFKSGCSVSAPASRQSSSDLQTTQATTSITSMTLDPNSGGTPLNLISEAAKQLTSAGVGQDKKSVMWDETHLFDIEQIPNPSTPALPKTPCDLKSRYKSEPNLSRSGNVLTPDMAAAADQFEGTPLPKVVASKSLTRKLMKGVSMGNLKFPFTTPESTKRLVRTVSSTLLRRSCEDAQIFVQAEGSSAAATTKGATPLLADVDDVDLDDDTFEDDPEDHMDSESDDAKGEIDKDDVTLDTGSSSSGLSTFTGASSGTSRPSVALYRNLDLITSTPSMLLGRRSMSPITKSTQRMPKAMQESIMTPRSRKPVMILTTTTNSADQNQTIYQADLSDFQDRDEAMEQTKTTIPPEMRHPPPPEVLNEDATSLGSYSDLLQHQLLEEGQRSFVQQKSKPLELVATTDNIRSISGDNEKVDSQVDSDPLSSDFKQYLLRRSVLTHSPVDSSFSSHSDDFGSSGEVEDIEESQLSSSLLYCLNGNRPETNTKHEHSLALEVTNNLNKKEGEENIVRDEGGDVSAFLTTAATSSNRLSTNPFVILNNARKRAATGDFEKMSATIFSNIGSQTSTVTSKEIRSSTLPSPSPSPHQTHSSANKENCEHPDDFRLTKKLLVSEYPGETSF